jgi:hypothetical protein
MHGSRRRRRRRKIYQHRMLENLNKLNLEDIAYWIAQACKIIDQRTERYLDKKENKLKIHQHRKQWKNIAKVLFPLLTVIPVCESMHMMTYSNRGLKTKYS